MNYKGLFLLKVFCCLALPMNAATVYYNHPDLHLIFALDTDTKEAKVGTGLESNKACAIAYPPLDDPWWDASPQENYWSDIIIPSTIQYGDETYTVTSIAPLAFYKETRVLKVSLPETIREIGSSAFYWCVNLRSINIPNQVTAINYGTFVWCNKLASIQLPDKISYIGSYAFSDCISLKEINIPGNCAFIGEEAFKWCTSLSTLNIEDGTTPLKIAYCYELGLNYEGAMPRHYRGMFSDCPLKSLHLGRDIEFYSENINKWYPPFMGYYYKGKDVNNKDVFIEEGKNYDEVTIGDNVTVIPESMFQYSTISNAITLPSHLISIGDDAFSNRSGTEGTLHQAQLVFPATLESIGKNAFTNCSALGTIICEGTTPPVLPDELYYHAFWNCNPLFIVPSGCRPTYLNSENWSKHKIVEMSDEVVTINVKTAGSLLDRLLAQGYQLNTIARLKLKGNLNDVDWSNIKKMSVLYDLDLSEIEIEEIAESQFANSSLVYISLPKTVRRICDNAFYQCKSLTGIVEIPESCTEIGKQAFRSTGITGLSYVGPLHFSEFAFSDCSGLEEVYVKGEGTVVDRHAFGSCGLKRMTIGKGVTMGEYAVPLCDNLKELVLEDGVKSLEDYSFNTSKVEKIYFEGSVKKIAKYVFRNEYIKEIHISDIGKWCQLPFSTSESHPLYKSNSSDPSPILYYNGEELVNIVIPEGVKCIGNLSFAYCSTLKSVKCNGTVESIGDRAFERCTQLENIQLSSNLKNIGYEAFYYCTSLTEIDLPNSIEVLGSYVFQGCKNLVKIVAHWKNPISVNSGMFSAISANCYLYMPIGTASLYSNSGWSCIPNLKAVGILSVKVNSGGSVLSLGNTFSDIESEVFFNPYQDVKIEITPLDGYKIFKMKLNGEDSVSELKNGALLIEDAEEDLTLSVVFAEERIEIGDANGDEVVDESDAIGVANHILRNTPSPFFGYAIDMNDDGIINITDILLVIKKIKEYRTE
jgi:hypothetical protein